MNYAQITSSVVTIRFNHRSFKHIHPRLSILSVLNLLKPLPKRNKSMLLRTNRQMRDITVKYWLIEQKLN